MKLYAVAAAVLLLASAQVRAAEGEKVSGKRISDSLKEELRTAGPLVRKSGERFCSRLERELGARWAVLAVSTGSASGAAADTSTPAGREMKAVELCLKVGLLENGARLHDESAVNIPDQKEQSLAIAAKLRRQSAEMESAAESVYGGNTGGRTAPARTERPKEAGHQKPAGQPEPADQAEQKAAEQK